MAGSVDFCRLKGLRSGIGGVYVRRHANNNVNLALKFRRSVSPQRSTSARYLDNELDIGHISGASENYLVLYPLATELILMDASP